MEATQSPLASTAYPLPRRAGRPRANGHACAFARRRAGNAATAGRVARSEGQVVVQQLHSGRGCNQSLHAAKSQSSQPPLPGDVWPAGRKGTQMTSNLLPSEGLDSAAQAEQSSL